MMVVDSFVAPFPFPFPFLFLFLFPFALFHIVESNVGVTFLILRRHRFFDPVVIEFHLMIRSIENINYFLERDPRAVWKNVSMSRLYFLNHNQYHFYLKRYLKNY